MHFSAALLTGGRSSRMGRDKAFLEIDGVPLWQRQLQTLQELGPSEIFLAGPTQSEWIESGLEIITDAAPDAGPLGGLVAALRRCTNTRLLLLAVDLPNMTSAFLSELLAVCPENGGIVPQRESGASFQLATQQQRELETCATLFEPLAAIYPKRSLALAESCLKEGHYSLQKFARCATDTGLVTIKEIAGAEESLFFNLNSPADLAAMGKK